MWKIILFFCILVLSLLGLAELMHRIWMFILKPKTTAKKFLIVFLNDTNAYEQLAYAQEHLRWSGAECAQGLIAVDCGLSDTVSEKCVSVCTHENGTYIYSLCELADIIKKESFVNGAGF